MTVSTFTADDLRALAGERSFARARDYLGAVAGLEVTVGGVTAIVHGGDAYQVTLTVDAGVTGHCDCPYGLDGNFCKHCVAVGLVVLDRGIDLPEARAAATDRGDRLDAWLEALPREDLLALLRERLAEDAGLRRRLEVWAAADAGADIAVLRPQIMRLLDPAPFSRYGQVEYADAPAYAAQAREAVDALRSLIAAGKASRTVTMSREAIERLRRIYEEIDDSAGAVGEVADELEETHREACAAAGADPVETAEWLAAHMLGEWSYVPEIELGDYWDLLGDQGRARFSELVAEASRHPSWATRSLGEDIARLKGDVDALVTSLAADLAPDGQTHRAIAEELDRAGRTAEALEWAERGLRETAPHPFGDDVLGDYLASWYERAGRLADVVTVRRERFRAAPSLGGYRSLRAAAREAGRWDAERAAALDLLRDEEPRAHRTSPLVDALIDDGDLDAAWRAADGRATERQWLALADLVREERPADALEVYRRAIEARTRLTGDGNYREIARLLLSVRDCHVRLGTDFTAYVAELRTAQRRKRNLMRILDQHGL